MRREGKGKGEEKEGKRRGRSSRLAQFPRSPLKKS